MKDILDFIDRHFNFLLIFIIIIVLAHFVNNRFVRLYDVQSTIVLHDYGQIFETVEDWKIWVLEHN